MAPINNVQTNLSGGAIAGIVIGVVVFIVILVLLLTYLARHKAAQAHQYSLQAQKERNAKGLTRERDGTLSTPRPDIPAQ